LQLDEERWAAESMDGESLMNRRRILIGLAVIAGALTLTGGAIAVIKALTSYDPATASRSITPSSYAPTSGLTVTIPSGATAQTLLNNVVKSFGGNAIISAEMTTTPAWALEPEAGSAAPPRTPGPWAHFLVSGSSAGAGEDLGVWEANIVVGALRDEMNTAGLSALDGCDISVQLPNGQVIDKQGGGIGNIAYGQDFSVTSATAATRQIAAAAAQQGLTVKSISSLRPLEPTPILITSTDDPTTVVNEAVQIEHEIFGSVGTYEGYYFEIDDSSGAPVLIMAQAFRAGVGESWLRPDLSSPETMPLTP
jgi:hypothetical protein